jgi:hypothetical protein
MAATTPNSGRTWMAIVGLIIGIIGFCGGGLIPFLGIIFPIIGLVLCFLGLQSPQRIVAIIGIVLNILALLAGIAISFFAVAIPFIPTTAP